MNDMSHLNYLNENYPVRKSAEDKEKFRNYIVKSLKEKGIEAKIERTADGKNDNIVVGDPTKAKAIFTAHYDTPARSLFPNIMMPKNRVAFYSYQFIPVIFLLVISLAIGYLVGNIILKNESVWYFAFLISYYAIFFLMMMAFTNKFNYNDNTSGVATVLSIIDGLNADELKDIAFILFDNEEKGKKGSAAYFKDHKEDMKDRFLVNFDCVGNGKNIIFIAQKDAADSDEYKILADSFEKNVGFSLDFSTYKNADANSDHKNFPKGIACVACKKAKNGLLYTPYIHTNKDVVANNGNIDFLSKNAIDFVRKMH